MAKWTLICPDGSKFWYQNGQLHRVGGPAITTPGGYQAWFQNGEYHRVNGPSLIRFDGTQVWCVYSKYHRVDGPAITWPDGNESWYLDDENREFNSKITMYSRREGGIARERDQCLKRLLELERELENCEKREKEWEERYEGLAFTVNLSFFIVCH